MTGFVAVTGILKEILKLDNFKMSVDSQYSERKD